MNEHEFAELFNMCMKLYNKNMAAYHKTMTVHKAQEKRRNELLQMDQNLAEDQKECEILLAAADQDIAELKMKLKKINGTRGNLIKKLNKISADRTAVHKEWIQKFSGENV